MRYLTPADMIVAHELLIAEFGGMRGITEAGFGRLESAAAAPRVSMFGADVYADVEGKAAALCFAIMRAHPFTDGNKRMALVALDVFLADNGYELTADGDDVYATMMALARGELEQAALAAWIAQHSSKV